MTSKSTFLGTIQDVQGTTISVSLANESLSGLTYVDGQGYRIGQIGSFVKIPIGYTDLFGIVTQVGASAVPEKQIQSQPYGNRWITIQLIGEGQRNGKFERGIAHHPTIGDRVHLVSENDLKRIYGQPDRPFFVKVGHVAGAESIPALVDVNKLVTRHCAVVGTTGSGKSTTVTSILSALSDTSKYKSARIIILDIHGEYSSAFRDKANIFKINPDKNSRLQEKELYLPFWALSFDELVKVSFGDFSNEKDRASVLEKMLLYKEKSLQKFPRKGIAKDTLSVDSPVPFSLNQLWYDLWCESFLTYYSDNGKKPIKENWAFEKDGEQKDVIGDVEKGIPPRFKPVKNVANDSEKIQYGPSTLNIRSQLEALGAKLRIPRYNFLLKPGEFTPDAEGNTTKDLDSLLKDWIGSDKPITILDLSGVPIDILNTVIGVLLRILYEGLFWARRLSQGGRERPLLIVMEEAHSYLNDNFKGLASTIVQKIVKEGRKYGIGAMIVSQRPSEINSTILSQCGTFFALRLANATDRGYITETMSENLEALTSMLPILRIGEAVIVGEAVKIPMRCFIEPPPKDRRPDSQDPIVYDEKSDEDSYYPGGWRTPMEVTPNYEEFMEVWRSQNPIPSKVRKD
ncbi:ATP-binding protein [Ohtaekwangia kribbensis]|uniref:ATP-binding protein n=1 Tax=Ohtaekwangia kribbensis TaxID=688913 RepID=A0ABW3K2Y6_9BACT